MTIQRQYSLPNCTLVLEGLADPIASSQAKIRPVMALLINAECYLAGQEKPLAGGREFFESLVTAVSLYAQEGLSGVHLPRHTYSDQPSFVRLERLGRSYHRLIVRQTPNNPNGEERSIDLNSVQLFDLVEAIDQFVADTLTLPFWSLNLSPVPKRYARSGEPLAKQVVPASIGVLGLALAAIAFFSIPTIRVKTPECLTPEASDCPGVVSNTPSSSASLTVNSNPSPSTQLPSPLNASLNASYARLEALLKVENWKGADEQTTNLMLKVSNREKDSYIDPASMASYPCEDLLRLDRLWKAYSSGRFGFSVQQSIWRSIGGVSDAPPKVYEQFGTIVGWRRDNAWRNYEKFDFTLQAPRGHLPTFAGQGLQKFGWGDARSVLLSYPKLQSISCSSSIPKN